MYHLTKDELYTIIQRAYNKGQVDYPKHKCRANFHAKEIKELIELKALKEALNMPCVVQSLPKQFSGQAYRKAHQVMNYEEFVAWWDSV